MTEVRSQHRSMTYHQNGMQSRTNGPDTRLGSSTEEFCKIEGQYCDVEDTNFFTGNIPPKPTAALFRASRNIKTRLSVLWSTSAVWSLILASGSSGFTSPAEVPHCMRIAAAAAIAAAAVFALLGKCSATCSVLSFHLLIPLSISQPQRLLWWLHATFPAGPLPFEVSVRRRLGSTKTLSTMTCVSSTHTDLRTSFSDFLLSAFS